MTNAQASLLKIATHQLQMAYFTGDTLTAWILNRTINQIRKNAGEEMLGWGIPTETLVDSGKMDSKGRSIGFLVCVNTNGKEFCCLVQNTRNGESFGVLQRSKVFKSENEALFYGNRTAKERIAKL